MSRLDRVWGSADAVTAFGPTSIPARSDLVAALHMLASFAGVTRVGWQLSDDGCRWSDFADLSDMCEASVHALPVVDGEEPDEFVMRARNHGRGASPLAICTANDAIALNVAHALGDGYYMSHLLPAVLTTAASGSPPDWARQAPARHPLSRALWSLFGRHPKRLRVLARELRNRPPADEVHDVGPLVTRDHRDACLYRGSSVEALTDLKKWRKAHASGVSTVPLTFALAELAQRQTGVAGREMPLVLVDGRRYVPRRAGEVSGNFCVGLRLNLADRYDGLSIDVAIRSAVEAGRPLSALAAAAYAPRPNRTEPETPTSYPKGWNAAYTHMGRPSTVNRLMRAGSTTLPYYLGSLTPAGLTGVTFAFAEVGNRLSVSASYHEGIVETEDVASVLELICGDPVGLLESHRRRTQAAVIG